MNPRPQAKKWVFEQKLFGQKSYSAKKMNQTFGTTGSFPGSSALRWSIRLRELWCQLQSPDIETIWGYDNFKVTPTGSFRGRTPFRFCCSFLSLTLRSLASTSSSIEDRGRVQTLGCRTGPGLDDVAAGSFLIGSLFSLPSCCPLWSTSASAGTSLSS